MNIEFLLDKFKSNIDKDAVIWNGRIYKYHDLLQYIDEDCSRLGKFFSEPEVVALESDFSPRAISLLLCLIELNCIVVPLTDSVSQSKNEFREVAEVERILSVKEDDSYTISERNRNASHPLLKHLKDIHHPGLILFSSGSTGKSKAGVHDFLPLLNKFKVNRKSMRTIAFLMFDHIGGINTLLYTLSNAGCIVTLSSRKPETVCRAIEEYSVELLPSSPTFINMLILSEAYKKHDISSLKMVTYGTEVMPECTLKKFNELFPQIQTLQTYGLSEIGIMRSKSRASDSLWVKVGGEDFKTRVVDGMLEIKTKSAMLGYLNSPSPFTEDGWFRTGDSVLTDGEYIRILGRQSEMINVGGQKVFPAEVENILMQMEGVEDVSVSGEDNLLTGQIVKAKIKLSTNETKSEFKERMKIFCKGKVETYKVPQKITLTESFMSGERFKKLRK